MEKKCTNCAVEVGGERGRFLERSFADLMQMVLDDGELPGQKKKGSDNRYLCRQLLCSERIFLQGSEARVVTQCSCTVRHDSVSYLETSDAGASLDYPSSEAHCFTISKPLLCADVFWGHHEQPIIVGYVNGNGRTPSCILYSAG
jgi:hypothetical protein